MAKFSGKIGYIKTEKTAPGVWSDNVVIEKTYYGDVLKNVRRWESGQNVNDDLSIKNTISIVADSFAYENIGYMKYVYWMGNKWKIVDVEVEHPRLTLTLGGIYNG